jgi:hypothetical protein
MGLTLWVPYEEVKDEKDLPEAISAFFHFRFGGIFFISCGSDDPMRVI